MNKYIALNNLIPEFTEEDLPDINSLNVPPEIKNKLKSMKGYTFQRAKCKSKSSSQTEEQRKEVSLMFNSKQYLCTYMYLYYFYIKTNTVNASNFGGVPKFGGSNK